MNLHPEHRCAIFLQLSSKLCPLQRYRPNFLKYRQGYDRTVYSLARYISQLTKEISINDMARCCFNLKKLDLCGLCPARMETLPPVFSRTVWLIPVVNSLTASSKTLLTLVWPASCLHSLVLHIESDYLRQDSVSMCPLFEILLRAMSSRKQLVHLRTVNLFDFATQEGGLVHFSQSVCWEA